MPGVTFSILSSVLIGYLLGAIPFGLLVARSRGIDIRLHGSGNIGATNVLRVLGKKWGILVFVLDALKGWLAVDLAMRWLPAGTHGAVLNGLVAAFACVLGHSFPVWLRFRGGKGVATTAGVLVSLMPLAAGVALLVWVAVFFSSRYVSLASIAAAIALPVSAALLGKGMYLLVFSGIVAALVIWRHRTNIERLRAGTENRFERRKP